MPPDLRGSRTAVLRAHRRLSGRGVDPTAADLARATGFSETTCRDRRAELAAEGLIRKTWRTTSQGKTERGLDEREHDQVLARIEAVRSARLLLNATSLEPGILAAVLP